MSDRAGRRSLWERALLAAAAADPAGVALFSAHQPAGLAPEGVPEGPADRQPPGPGRAPGDDLGRPGDPLGGARG